MKNLLFAIGVLTLIFCGGEAEAAKRHKMSLPFPVTQSTEVRYLEVNTLLGEDFEITLAANPTTGYEWRAFGRLPAALSFVSRAFEPPESGIAGAGGTERLRYHANATGHNHIILQYARPWEEGAAAYPVCCVYVKLPNQP